MNKQEALEFFKERVRAEGGTMAASRKWAAYPGTISGILNGGIKHIPKSLQAAIGLREEELYILEEAER